VSFSSTAIYLRAHVPLRFLLPLRHEHLLLRLQERRVRFLPVFVLAHLLIRRIFLPERDRRDLRRLRFTFLQYPALEPFLPVTHVVSGSDMQAFLPMSDARLTRLIFLRELRRRLRRLRLRFFPDEERDDERRRDLRDLRDLRRRDLRDLRDFFAHEGLRSFLPLRLYLPLR